MNDSVVIAGAGHAAGQAAATLRQKHFGGDIVLVGDEPYFPYQRPPLSKKFLAGELPAERLYVKPESFYRESDIQVLLGHRATSIDRAGKQLILSDGDRIGYGKMIIATGAKVRRLAVPGADLAGVHYLRGIRDVLDMRQEMQAGRRMVVIGAGYIGLEVAAVACQLGLDVSVIEMQDRVMSRVVSEQLSRFYESEHQARGVRFFLSTGLASISGDDRVRAIITADGNTVPADIVLIGIGIEPEVDLAAAAGLAIDNGIVVDDRCQTSDADIYAIGDCTFHPNSLLGRSVRLESVHNALEQAKTAAQNICGVATQYSQVPWFWSDQYDLKLQIAGLSQGYDQTVMRGDPATRSFSCLYLQDGTLIAVDAVNCPRDFMQAKALIGNHAVIAPERLADSDIALKDMELL
jgi:3-phenylpropionate/trans-cinnamate dioxygenase ferredoxin reductase subunit